MKPFVRPLVFTLIFCSTFHIPRSAFAMGEWPKPVVDADPSHIEKSVDPFIQEFMLRDRYTVRGRVAEGDKNILSESSKVTWYTDALAKAWIENQAEQQQWDKDTIARVTQREAQLLSESLVFHVYLEGKPEAMGLNPELAPRLQAQLLDDNNQVSELSAIKSGDGLGLAYRGAPTLTLLFPANDAKTGQSLLLTRHWLHLAIMVDGSRYFFDFPVQRI